MSDLENHIDVILVEKMKAGDESAFRAIYDRYNGLLFAYAFRKLQLKEEAKDVVQEIFIRLWENRREFQLKTYLSGFLYKSVLNRILDIWKHDKVIRKHVLDQSVEIDVDSYGTDYLVREKEIAEIIQKEISALPPRMREIYELKHKKYLTSKQIAAELGISENTVTTQLQRASGHLKNKLGLVVFLLHLTQRY